MQPAKSSAWLKETLITHSGHCVVTTVTDRLALGTWRSLKLHEEAPSVSPHGHHHPPCRWSSGPSLLKCTW